MKRKKKLFFICLVLSFVSINILFSILLEIVFRYFDPYERVQIRNALVLRKGKASDFEWIPGDEPPEFLLEDRKDIPEFMIDVVNNIEKENGVEKENNLNKAIAIVEHHGQMKRKGWVYANTFTQDVYKKIRDGQGVCSDYAQVFTGLCNAAGIPVRAWAASSETFTGHGDSFNEIYDEDFKKWIFIDAWKALYVKDTNSNIPLSFLEFRDMVLRGKEDEINIVNIVTTRRRPMDSKSIIFSYKYGNSLNKSYLIFGNNVFGEDNFWFNKLFIPRSREIAQLGSIMLGHFPKFMVIRNRIDIKAWKEILSLRKKIYMSLAMFIIFLFSIACVILSLKVLY